MTTIRSTPAGKQALAILAAYDSIVALASEPARRASAPELDLAGETQRMRTAFERRTGAFGPEDAWFESRSRAFWDDALTTQGFAALAAPHAGREAAEVAPTFDRAHRGLFVVEEVDDAGAHLVDLWSGAELLVTHLDEAQALSLAHADSAFDGRVVASGSPDAPTPVLLLLPGCFHHAPDALEPIQGLLGVARERALERGAVLDALLRMDHVFRSSSRVKPAFAYKVESLPRA